MKLISPLKVLVVDDEPMVRQVITEYLTSDGHTVECAKNGREGLEKFRAGSFDLILTDRAIPDMSGDQLAAAIKTLAPRPVIMLTGFGQVIRARGEKPTGVDLVVSKPVTRAELQLAVSMVVSKYSPQDGMEELPLRNDNLVTRKGDNNEPKDIAR